MQIIFCCSVFIIRVHPRLHRAEPCLRLPLVSLNEHMGIAPTISRLGFRRLGGAAFSPCILGERFNEVLPHQACRAACKKSKGVMVFTAGYFQRCWHGGSQFSRCTHLLEHVNVLPAFSLPFEAGI